MALLISVRGTGTQAYYSLGPGAAATYGTVTVDAGAGTGIIGSSVVNLDQGSFAQRALVYDGHGNMPTTQKMSVLIRCAAGDTTNLLNLFGIAGTAGNWNNQSRLNGAGGLSSSFGQTPGGASLLTQTATFAYTANTYFDHVFLIDGTLTTGAVLYYADAVLKTTSNFSATRAALASSIGSTISIGSQSTVAQNSTRIKLNEFCIWDTIIDPTSVQLSDGNNASLNGASRSLFVNANQSNGSLGPSRSRTVNNACA